MSSPERGQWARQHQPGQEAADEQQRDQHQQGAANRPRALETAELHAVWPIRGRLGERAQLSGCGARSRRRFVSTGRRFGCDQHWTDPAFLRGLAGQRVELGGELLISFVQRSRPGVKRFGHIGWGPSTGGSGRVYARPGAGGCASSHPGGTGRLLVRRGRAGALTRAAGRSGRKGPRIRSPGRRSTWTPRARRRCRRGGGARRAARPTPRP